MISKFFLVGFRDKRESPSGVPRRTKRLKCTVLHSTRVLIFKINKHRVVENNKLKRSR